MGGDRDANEFVPPQVAALQMSISLDQAGCFQTAAKGSVPPRRVCTSISAFDGWLGTCHL